MSNSAFKKLRLSKGYSQTELARLLNVTVRAISRWENRQQKIPYMALLSMAGLKPKKATKGKR
jgi:transcriptional regulator with XRE-family HTH domain